MLRLWVLHIKKESKYKQRSEPKRNEYMEIIKDIDINKIHYLDEMGVDNNTVTTRGWSEAGKKKLF